MKFSSLLPVAAVFLALPATAAVYKWTDANGKVQYGDRPPDTSAQVAADPTVLPAGLQNRLRSLDPNFNITRFVGDNNIAMVCGEFNPDVADAEKPVFPVLVESTGIGKVRTSKGYFDNEARDQRLFQSDYDRRLCPPATQTQSDPCSSYRYTGNQYEQCKKRQTFTKRIDNIKRFSYQIRFSDDVLREFHIDNSTSKSGTSVVPGVR